MSGTLTPVGNFYTVAGTGLGSGTLYSSGCGVEGSYATVQDLEDLQRQLRRDNMYIRSRMLKDETPTHAVRIDEGSDEDDGIEDDSQHTQARFDRTAFTAASIAASISTSL